MDGQPFLLGDTGSTRRQCLMSHVMAKGLTIVATHDHYDRGGWTRRRTTPHSSIPYEQRIPGRRTYARIRARGL
jgi:hypothetical protein